MKYLIACLAFAAICGTVFGSTSAQAFRPEPDTCYQTAAATSLGPLVICIFDKPDHTLPVARQTPPKIGLLELRTNKLHFCQSAVRAIQQPDGKLYQLQDQRTIEVQPTMRYDKIESGVVWMGRRPYPYEQVLEENLPYYLERMRKTAECEP